MSDEGGLTGRAEPVQTGGTVRRDGYSRDELFRILAHERRRQVLATLWATESGVPVDELATRLASAESRADESTSEAARKEVETSLVHVHLPKLVDAGLVEWCDRERKQAVEPTAEGDALPTELSWLPPEMPVPDE